MRRHKLFIIALGCLILVGCTGSEEKRPANFSESLIVVPGAKNMHYTKVYGTDQLYFQIKAEYPAKAVLEEISKKLEIKGWHPLPEDYLNPGLPSSHVRGWTDFVDATEAPEKKVYQWLAQWENKNKDILWCTLRYSYPKREKPILRDLTVYESFMPSKLAIEARTKAIETTSQNKQQ